MERPCASFGEQAENFFTARDRYSCGAAEMGQNLGLANISL